MLETRPKFSIFILLINYELHLRTLIDFPAFHNR